jgi:hypothetical protein
MPVRHPGSTPSKTGFAVLIFLPIFATCFLDAIDAIEKTYYQVLLLSIYVKNSSPSLFALSVEFVY